MHVGCASFKIMHPRLLTHDGDGEEAPVHCSRTRVSSIFSLPPSSHFSHIPHLPRSSPSMYYEERHTCVHVRPAWGGSRYRSGVRSAWISPWPVGVGKLSKITDKYSTSNEHHARRLDLAILIMARRARRSAARRSLIFLAAFFLAFVCGPPPSPPLPPLSPPFSFHLVAATACVSASG